MHIENIITYSSRGSTTDRSSLRDSIEASWEAVMLSTMPLLNSRSAAEASHVQMPYLSNALGA
jgi:hypothetical protein